jgi:hypothetical protein
LRGDNVACKKERDEKDAQEGKRDELGRGPDLECGEAAEIPANPVPCVED